MKKNTCLENRGNSRDLWSTTCFDLIAMTQSLPTARLATAPAWWAASFQVVDQGACSPALLRQLQRRAVTVVSKGRPGLVHGSVRGRRVCQELFVPDSIPQYHSSKDLQQAGLYRGISHIDGIDSGCEKIATEDVVPGGCAKLAETNKANSHTFTLATSPQTHLQNNHVLATERFVHATSKTAVCVGRHRGWACNQILMHQNDCERDKAIFPG